MSSEKGIVTKPYSGPAATGGCVDAALPGARRRAAVAAFEVDEYDDPGGDPYNHTGSYCVPEFGNE